MTDKNALRMVMKSVRDALAADERAKASDQIRQRAIDLPELRSADGVFIYVSFRSEVQTHALIEDLLAAGKVVTVPHAGNGDQMEAHRIDKLSDLRPGRFGFPAPVNTKAYREPIDICIAPGLAFTERGDRLGYGQGHYDRFLAAHPLMTTVALAFEAQVTPELPTEVTDRAMDVIVTERRVIRVRDE